MTITTRKSIQNREISIGFVVYNPAKSLLDRLKIAEDAGFMLYVFDNSPQEDFIRHYCNASDNCKYQTLGKNAGLGIGISSVCATAYYDGFPALIFFDQDTVFGLNTLLFINDFYNKKDTLKTEYSAIVFNSKTIRLNDTNSDSFAINDVKLAINSGSLYFLENLEILNWFDETFFVDCVDYEFCLRSNNNHLKIGECSMTPGFDHVTEQEDKRYIIFGKELMMRKYSINRLLGTIKASLRIAWISIKTQNFKFTIYIIRSLTIYLFFQFLVRIAIVLKFSNKKIT